MRTPRTKPVDHALLTIMIMLLMLGLLTLFSATYYKAQDGGDPLSEVKKQLFGVAVGAAAMAFTARVPYAFWGRKRVVTAGVVVSCALLILVAIPGIGRSVNGSRRWLALGPLSFQPGELAKYAAVLFMATTLTARGQRIEKLFSFTLKPESIGSFARAVAELMDYYIDRGFKSLEILTAMTEGLA